MRRRLIAVLAISVCLAGCGKVPTFSELVNGKKPKEEPKAAPPAPPPVEQPKGAPVVQEPPPRPARSSQEVIAQFKTTPTQQRSDSLIAELANMRDGKDQITDMDLSYSQGITEAGISQLPKLDHIEKLSLDYCSYTNSALRDVANMKSVTTLSIKGGAVKDKNSDLGFGYIKGMKTVTSLAIDRSTFTRTGLEAINAMTWLESLSINDAGFDDESLSALGGLTHLKYLSLAGTAIDDDGFQYLAPFGELETLNISNLKRVITGKGLKDVASPARFPNLRAIHLYADRGLRQAMYEGLFKLRGSLEVLDLTDTNCTNYFFINGVAKLTKLQELYLARNGNLTDDGMQKLPNLKSLKRLRFEKNPGIGDATVKFVARLGKSLEAVTFAETGVNEKAIKWLKKKLPKADIWFNGTKIED